MMCLGISTLPTSCNKAPSPSSFRREMDQPKAPAAVRLSMHTLMLWVYVSSSKAQRE